MTTSISFFLVFTELHQPLLNFTFTNQTSLGLNWGFNNQQVFFEYFNFSYVLISGNTGNTSSSPSGAPSPPNPNNSSSFFETILPLWQDNLEVTNLIPGARYTFELQAIGDLSASPLTQMSKATREYSYKRIVWVFKLSLLILRWQASSSGICADVTAVIEVRQSIAEWAKRITAMYREWLLYLLSASVLHLVCIQVYQV